MTSLPRPPGLIAALVGGALGAGIGWWASNLVSEQLKVGDLSDISTAILLFLAGLVVGPSVGATLVLALRKHDRSLATGLLVGPFVVLAIIGGFISLSLLPMSDKVAGIIGQPVLVAYGIAAIWMARWVTTR